MKLDYKVLFQLFRSTFSLSAFTFGGGYVIVPLMQKKFVEEYEWIDKYEKTGEIPLPNNSYGNGSAMRVSPVAYVFDEIEKVEKYARLQAEVKI